MITTKLKIRLYGDPCLRKKSSSVKEVGPSERMLIQSMIATMHQEKGIGLAAPQVGINQKIMVVDIGDGPIAMVNPRIIKQTGKDQMQEGCLSIPNIQIMIKRAQKVLVKYLDEHNHEHERTFDELLARVIQHENDHLNGKLIVDYATNAELKKYKDQLKEIKELQKEQ